MWEKDKGGIFMSPFDVHVNRVPYDGIVDYLEYVPGKSGWLLPEGF